MADSFQNEVPKARINLKLDLHTGGASKKMELPLKLLVAGDFSNGQDTAPIFEREKVNITKNNFDSVLSEYSPKVNLTVKNTLADDGGEDNIQLTFQSMKDFTPEQVAAQMPALRAQGMSQVAENNRHDFLLRLGQHLKDGAVTRWAQQLVPWLSVSQQRVPLEQLQQQMDEWLTGTGLNVSTVSASVSDLLVEGGAFEISGIVLRYDSRAVKFMPIFLYGQGVAGCVEVTFCAGENVISQGRLFMRVGGGSDWIFTPPDTPSRSGQLFDEGIFFGLILALLP